MQDVNRTRENEFHRMQLRRIRERRHTIRYEHEEKVARRRGIERGREVKDGE